MMFSITTPEAASIDAERSCVDARLSLVPPVTSTLRARTTLTAKRSMLARRAEHIEDRSGVLY